MSNRTHASSVSIYQLTGNFFLQDSELYHTAKWVKHFTEAQIIEIMKWLAQSHKLNPNQNHRKITGGKIIANKPSTHFTELWKRLEEEWSEIKSQNSENRFLFFLLISLKAVNIKKNLILLKEIAVSVFSTK